MSRNYKSFKKDEQLYEEMDDSSLLEKLFNKGTSRDPSKVQASVLKIPQEKIIGASICVSEPSAEKAPMIERTGFYPPTMTIEKLGGRTTDADAQRFGLNFLDKAGYEDFKKQFKKLELLKESKEKYEILKQIDNYDPVLKKMKKDDNDNKAYLSAMHVNYYDDKMFTTERPTSHDVILQGLGDVGMNEWSIAVTWCENDKRQNIYAIPNENLDERVYSCISLVKKDVNEPSEKWAGKNVLNIGCNESYDAYESDLIISDVVYNQYGDEDKRAIINSDGKRVRIPDAKNTMPQEFSVYGQRIVWEGRLVERAEIVTQFSDIRHIFKLPDLNPKLNVEERRSKDKKIKDVMNTIENEFKNKREESELKKFLIRKRKERKSELEKAYSEWPRCIFGSFLRDSMWLGEYALLKDENLQRVACRQAISIPLRELGGSLIWITARLIWSGYKFKSRPDLVREEGDFSWDVSDVSNPKLYWYLIEARYPCTLIGIGSKHLYLLAWRYVGGFHDSDYQATTIFECGEILRQLGAYSVILMDEGQDVFQRVLPGGEFKDIVDFVKPARTRIKGTIAFALKDNEES